MSVDDRADAPGPAVPWQPTPSILALGPQSLVRPGGGTVQHPQHTVQRTKYDHVVANLGPEHVAEVRDIDPQHSQTGTYPACMSSRATTLTTTLSLNRVGREKALADPTPYAATSRRQHYRGGRTTLPPTLPPAATSHGAHGGGLLRRHRQPRGGDLTRRQNR